MADLNDALFDAIKRSTGDELKPEIKVSSDNELLKAMLSFMTVMLKRILDSEENSEEQKGADITQPITSVVPFVS